jgi:hypothetical protein
MWVIITVRWLKNSYVWSCALQAKMRGREEIQGLIETVNRAYFPVLQLTLRPDISWGVPVIHRLPLFGLIVLYGS